MNAHVTDPVCAIREDVERRVGAQRFKVWFKNATHFAVVDNHVRIGVPNQFIGNWIESHFAEDIRQSASAVLGKAVSLHFSIDPKLFGRQPATQLDFQARSVHRASEPPPRGPAGPRSSSARPAPAGPAAPARYRLEDFVVGPANRLAFTTIQDVLRGGPRRFNPLYLYGSCGLGKTHLLHGLCQALAAAGRAAAYVTGEEFTNEYILAVRKNQTETFRERYRHLDVLVMDDVQFLANKKGTQDELLHTFDAIDAAGKQIVMASDAQPKLLGELSAGLVNRFMSGMVLRIDPPDAETRRAILRRKAAALAKPVPELVIAYVAELFNNNIRELEGALLKLYAYSCLAGQPITLNLARTALEEYAAKVKPVVQVADIEASVGNYFGVTTADLHSTNRTRTVALARNVAMYVARQQTRMSYPEIAKHMGGKNHATVLLGCRRIQGLLDRRANAVWHGAAGLVERPMEEVLQAILEAIGGSSQPRPAVRAAVAQ